MYNVDSDKKSFFRWLDQANDLELQKGLLSLEAIGNILTETEVINEFHWRRRMFLLEIDARLQLKRMPSQMAS